MFGIVLMFAITHTVGKKSKLQKQLDKMFKNNSFDLLLNYINF